MNGRCSTVVVRFMWKSVSYGDSTDFLLCSCKHMWPRRFSLRALLALTAIVAFLLAIWPRSYSLTRAHFDLLKTGMEQSEIENLIGRSGNKLRRRAIVWDPQNNGRPISAEVSPGPLELDFFPTAKNEGQQGVWLTRTGLIAVYFGEDGKLQDKYFSTVHPVGPPPLLYGFEVQASPTND